MRILTQLLGDALILKQGTPFESMLVRSSAEKNHSLMESPHTTTEPALTKTTEEPEPPSQQPKSTFSKKCLAPANWSSIWRDSTKYLDLFGSPTQAQQEVFEIRHLLSDRSLSNCFVPYSKQDEAFQKFLHRSVHPL